MYVCTYTEKANCFTSEGIHGLIGLADFVIHTHVRKTSCIYWYVGTYVGMY
jgi:hypothetical protein